MLIFLVLTSMEQSDMEAVYIALNLEVENLQEIKKIINYNYDDTFYHSGSNINNGGYTYNTNKRILYNLRKR